MPELLQMQMNTACLNKPSIYSAGTDLTLQNLWILSYQYREEQSRALIWSPDAQAILGFLLGAYCLKIHLFEIAPVSILQHRKVSRSMAKLVIYYAVSEGADQSTPQTAFRTSLQWTILFPLKGNVDCQKRSQHTYRLLIIFVLIREPRNWIFLETWLIFESSQNKNLNIYKFYIHLDVASSLWICTVKIIVLAS